ncbi:MAG: hypothetical protein Q8P44_05375 [Dehalococcoidia bacterium]|nr:hypothetical protein [Dehalococcoidia bacterium]
MAGKRNGTQYVGFTGDLVQRVYAHKHDLVEGFTNKKIRCTSARIL